MQPATSEFLGEYYKVAINAQTEEEILEIKESMRELLKSYEYSDEAIENFFETADKMVDELVFQDLEAFIEYNYPEMSNIRETESTQEVTNNNTQALASGIVGVGLITIMTALALKKKYLKNKQKTR